MNTPHFQGEPFFVNFMNFLHIYSDFTGIYGN